MIEDELAHDMELSQLYRGERTDDSEVYELYLSQLASGVRGYQIPDFRSYLRDQFDSLESGEITPDFCVTQISPYAGTASAQLQLLPR